MNEEHPPPPPQEPEAIVNEEEQMPVPPQSTLPFPETVDLNAVFPEEESDLNDLFPDEETKILLKKIQRNKKDLHTMTDRFAEEDWSGTSNDTSDPSDEGGNEPQESTDTPPA